MKKKDQSKLPKGWTERRVQRLIKHYEAQREDEAVAEDERAYKRRTLSLIAIPVKLVPAVRKLITRRAS